MGIDREGTKDMPTCTGSIFTLIVLCIMISYAIQKTNVFIQKRQVDIAESVDSFFYSEDDLFTAKQGLQIAVAFASLDNYKEELDPAYGEIAFYRSEWTATDITYEGLPSHKCSQEEIGLVDTDTNPRSMEPR